MMRAAIVVAVVVVILGAVIRWQWRECRKVGHGVVYCLSKVTK